MPEVHCSVHPAAVQEQTVKKQYCDALATVKWQFSVEFLSYFGGKEPRTFAGWHRPFHARFMKEILYSGFKLDYYI